MTIKDRVRELCKTHSTNASALEKACGFANGYISKLDKSVPNARNIQKIADYFGVTADYILKGDVNDQLMELAEKTIMQRELETLLEDDSIRELVLFAGGMPSKDRKTFTDAYIAAYKTLRGVIE